MEKWKFDDKALKKIYKESKKDLKMSYKDFKKMAESFASQLIENTKREVENERVT